MSEMIDRVARRLYDSNLVEEDMANIAWGARGMEERWRELARVAIEAMREPDLALFDAGGRAMCVYPNAKWDDPHVKADVSGLRTATVEVIDRTWRAMIDEALKP